MFEMRNALAAVIVTAAFGIVPARAAAAGPPPAGVQAAGAMPRPDHVVIVIEENKAFSTVIDSTLGKLAAPYINALANEGALFTNSYALTHPSQPNYLALFSGNTHGAGDDCLSHLTGPNLGSELRQNGLGFAIYSESLPAVGYEGCFSEDRSYARKHNPAVNWQGHGLPAEINLPFDRFPQDYAQLPTVSIVVPNMSHDMHDGHFDFDKLLRGDRWLKQNLSGYVRWAQTHNSLLILTWDEDDKTENNRIVTVFVGPMVKPGRYPVRITHYSVLRTIEDMYGLPRLGQSASAAPITEIWRPGAGATGQAEDSGRTAGVDPPARDRNAFAPSD